MRHQVARRKLGRKSAHRWAMFRNMATSLVEHERIETTLCNAKEIRSFAENLITLGKKNTLPARREALSFVRSESAVSKIFSQLAPRFAARNGGYTRIMRLGYRHGDSSPMAVIEYLPGQGEVAEASKANKKTAATRQVATRQAVKKAAPTAKKKEKVPAKKDAKKKKSAPF